MNTSRGIWHKHPNTGGKRKPWLKQRNYEIGPPPSNIKIDPHQVHTGRAHGGKKYCSLQLDFSNFSGESKCRTCKTRFIEAVYNASNNELVTITLTDSTPQRHPLNLAPQEEEVLKKNPTKKINIQKKYDEWKNAKISNLEEQFQQGELLACIASKPDSILEGKKLEFYSRKIKAKKGK
uniref:Uncharacterized protein n=1 Tax=Pelodiscus sinensis TaxID=13735 RepID=K7FB63_PELSI